MTIRGNPKKTVMQQTYRAYRPVCSRKMEVSINGQTDKPNMMDGWNGMLVSLKREGYFDICYNMDKPWRYDAK